MNNFVFNNDWEKFYCNEFKHWRVFNDRWKIKKNRLERLVEYYEFLNTEELAELDELKNLLKDEEEYSIYVAEQEKLKEKKMKLNERINDYPTLHNDVVNFNEEITELTTQQLYHFINHFKHFISELKSKLFKNVKFIYHKKYNDENDNPKLPEDKLYVTYFYTIIACMIDNENEGYVVKNIKKIYVEFMEQKLKELTTLYEGRKDEKNVEIKEKKELSLKEKRLCEFCGIEVSKRNWAVHLNTKSHKEKSGIEMKDGEN
ncbi:MAG: hypothetical protein EBR82_34290 [Caulobacteraceae bacterium]|nr:hypothetical protein [Caulobacteraceae bacterium]